MSYTTLLVLTIQLLLLPFNAPLTTSVENRAHNSQGEVFYKPISGQSAPPLLVLQDPKSTGEKQQPYQSEKETTETKKEKYTSPQQEGKKQSSKDFVPSEKIKADKAVDFPADI
ncbi:MAG: hypothetical protein R3339_03415 [Thermodesulfobacteriota bacterium]|nr:hypothetical protein [Thermodesulfobacteriota bacterium]